MLTLDATYVTSSSANLNGTVNPQGSPGSAFFLWGTTPTLSSFPDDNNTPLQSVVVNFTAQSFTASLTGLATGMTYYYQIGFFDAANSSYQYGAVLSFKTLAPAMVTQPATSITNNGATLNGTVDPEGSGGQSFFLWGTTPTLSSWPNDANTPLQSVVVNFTAQSFTASLSGLASGTTYYYQMGFYNTANSTYQYGAVLSFTTLTPVLVTQARSGITNNGATLNGTVNPEGSGGQSFFLWGTTPTLSSWPNDANTPLQSVVVNFTAQSFTASLSGLASGTTYYYQMGFYNTANSTYQYGAVLSFTTLTPVLVTQAPTGTTSNGATLNGTVNPEGSGGQSFFLWGTTPTLSSWPNDANTPLQSVVVNFTAQSFTASLSGLASGTTCYYQMGFYNTANSTYQYGAVLSFTTLTPVLVTQAPTGITSNGATLNGTVNPEGSGGQSFLFVGNDFDAGVV